jgi:hypothetical protein
MNTNKKSYGDFAAGTPRELTEDLNKFAAAFRSRWYSSKTMRFKDWIGEVEDLLDLLG